MDPLDVGGIDHLDFINSELGALTDTGASHEVTELRQKIAELKEFASRMNGPQKCNTSVGAMTLEILGEFVDNEIRSVVFEMHRAYKLGLLADPSRAIMPSNKGLVNLPGLDIFGRKPEKNSVPSFSCPNCGSLRQPAKFAPHLEKCMGMGGRTQRTSARTTTTTTTDNGSNKRKQDIKSGAAPDDGLFFFEQKKQKVVEYKAEPEQEIITNDDFSNLLLFEGTNEDDDNPVHDFWD
eukprot:m.10916 g.10916  ORF g.10916 m.10916 type:complete len:237 (-) comp8554_c0_seq1:108-818(-)